LPSGDDLEGHLLLDVQAEQVQAAATVWSEAVN
jgi:hypothetical protein